MKKNLFLILLLLVTLCLFSCETEGNKNPSDSHKHSFSTVWEKDEYGHWHECECGEKEEVDDHYYTNEWLKDENGHWHVCICGLKGQVGNHDFGAGIVKYPATETENGLMVYACSDCGYVKEEIIPMINNSPSDDPYADDIY